jgi:hypothetical protein
MKTIIASVLFACALATAGSATVAAPDQEYPTRPGEATRAKVWVQNRGKAEAIPVAIEAMDPAAPLTVQVIGVPAVTMSAATIVQAKLLRQPWEYRVVAIASGQDAANALATVGLDGWETTGVQLPAASGTSLLLKRPR